MKSGWLLKTINQFPKIKHCQFFFMSENHSATNLLMFFALSEVFLRPGIVQVFQHRDDIVYRLSNCLFTCLSIEMWCLHVDWYLNKFCQAVLFILDPGQLLRGGTRNIKQFVKTVPELEFVLTGMLFIFQTSWFVLDMYFQHYCCTIL